jgi:hypothetical protein
MKKCNVIGCNGQHYSKGLCQKHYRQQVRGTLKEPVKDTDSLLSELKSYEDTIKTIKNIFVLIDSLLEEVQQNELLKDLDSLLNSNNKS